MDALDELQAEKLKRFQEITNCEDVQIAIGTLASLDWDLAKAIEMQMSSPMDTDDGDFNSQFNLTSTNMHHENGHNGVNGALHFNGSSGDEEADMDIAGSSKGRTGTKKPMSAKPNGLRKSNLNTSKNPGPSSSSSLGTSIRSRTTAVEAVANEPVLPTSRSVLPSTRHLDSSQSSDDDLDDYDYHNYDNDNAPEEKPPATASNNVVPLVPVDFSSVVEALNNFSAVYESRYNVLLPPLYNGELREAAREAFEAPRRPVAERRPLAVYLHRDGAVACNIFAQVFCSESVSALLRRQFVLWAWDATQQENKQKLIEWMEQLGVRDIRQTMDRMTGKFPLLMVLIKERGSVQTFDIATGFDDAQSVVDKLMSGLDNYQQIKSGDAQVERERLEREQIRQEQAREYEESLAADRARMERLEKEKKKEMEEEAARLRAKEVKLKKEAELAASLPPEPLANEKDVICVRIRFPKNADNGSQKDEVRRFRTSEPLKHLATFVESKGYSLEQHKILTSDYPRKDMVAHFDLSRSFKDLEWPVREQVIVDEKF